MQRRDRRGTPVLQSRLKADPALVKRQGLSALGGSELRSVGVLASLLIVVGCGGTPASPTPVPTPVPTPPPAPRVMVISIDGLRADAVYATETPNIRALVGRGSYTWQAQTINPSNTLPSHVSMVTGVTPTVHKITWDEYLPNRGKLAVPTLFSAVATADKRSAMVAGKDKFLTIRDAGGIDVCVLSTRGDIDVANQTILQIDAGFDFVFVHFPDVDLSGHAYRWMSPQYLQSLQVVDQALGRILNAVPFNMTVILTADHGG